MQRSLECKVAWFENQVKREVEAREIEGAKHAQQQEQLQASRDALQKHLAVTEAEFRLALQVLIRLPFQHASDSFDITTDIISIMGNIIT